MTSNTSKSKIKDIKPQVTKFKEIAHELECDEDEEHFERTLKSISTTKKGKPAD